MGYPSHVDAVRWIRCAGVTLGAALLLAGLATAEDQGICLVRAARRQIGVTLHYDPSYRQIAFPNGDIGQERGVCTDVLVRAYRALGVDLQVLIHEDMRDAFQDYPQLWGLSRPDPNIDHRRVPNLARFFRRHGRVVPPAVPAADGLPGDIVTWRLPSGVPHIGIVSDRRAPSGTPLVIHNLGRGTVEEDVLLAFPRTGHYRFLPMGIAGECDDRE